MNRSHDYRFYLLDILRGFAALSVVIWHYQHFFFQGTVLPANFDRSIQPFYGILRLFYQEGSRAVQLFFVLSGFIFFSQYLQLIRDRKVSASNFFVLRFSRLYPLYFLTLVMVAVGQQISHAVDGTFIVYPCNNIPRFILALSFISEWLPQKYVCSVAFNGPAWSLSVEAFLYFTFFVFARYIASTQSVLAFLMTIVGAGIGFFAYVYDLYDLLGEPILCFYSGGVAFFIWKRLKDRNRLLLLFVSAVLTGGALLYTVRAGINGLILDAVLYPAIVLFLAMSQTREQGKSFRLIGDITYASYLLHFPIQLYIILVLKLSGLRLDFLSPFFWSAYFSMLIVISIVSFEFFERPAQRYLRKIYELKFKPLLNWHPIYAGRT
ncbi:MAG: acyltransferase family protein [Methylovirgula sp.]